MLLGNKWEFKGNTMHLQHKVQKNNQITIHLPWLSLFLFNQSLHLQILIISFKIFPLSSSRLFWLVLVWPSIRSICLWPFRLTWSYLYLKRRRLNWFRFPPWTWRSGWFFSQFPPWPLLTLKLPRQLSIICPFWCFR